jgi:hypothetical protein
MLLFEFDTKQKEIDVGEIVALTNQLQQEIEDGEIDPDNYTVDDLLDYFQQYDVILDVDNLYDMTQVPPFSDVVTNIQGDKVVFKGHDSKNIVDKPEGDDKKTVAQMAKRAMKI